ncbi:hypothetical protein TNCV_4369841 [Trichonephila clavipes]|nr:hypothetical protein TNCV_4369841 [Trichonephila clavipes]
MFRARIRNVREAPHNKRSDKRRSTNVFGILPWPANSPDMNPIEHLWDIIRRDMDRGPPVQTVDLRIAVDVALQRLPQATINGLIQHFSNCVPRSPRKAC